MNMKKLGTSGVQVSEMILGCWVMGGAQWGGADDNESIRAINWLLMASAVSSFTFTLVLI